uniref:Uncharacterized protein n=1 Tax=Rangifer tarandus platyrhynchus TaxID=3082113 RepID=A0ACB0F7F6_RANTA|nr:unnamed protein product [Rangifer tarandus platyrhynchus]
MPTKRIAGVPGLPVPMSVNVCVLRCPREIREMTDARGHRGEASGLSASQGFERYLVPCSVEVDFEQNSDSLAQLTSASGQEDRKACMTGQDEDMRCSWPWGLRSSSEVGSWWGRGPLLVRGQVSRTSDLRVWGPQGLRPESSHRSGETRARAEQFWTGVMRVGERAPGGTWPGPSSPAPNA